MSTVSSDIKILRQQLRVARRALTEQQQIFHATLVRDHVMRNFAFESRQRVALSLSFDGEVSLTPLVQALWQKNVMCYLPCLQSNKTLLFAEWQSDTTFKQNQFGILEPVCDSRLSANEMDVLLMPLVGVDAQGHRLGMGGGYYDRTLGQCVTRPYLIGLAHSCQQVEALSPEPWDIPLNALVTELGLTQWQDIEEQHT